MSRDLLKYNPRSSNFQISPQSSGIRCCSIATRPSDHVRVKETAKKKTVVTPRRYTTTETRTRTVEIRPKQKRGAAGPRKQPPAKRARMKVSTKTKSCSNNKVSSSSRVSCSKNYSSSEESSSYYSESCSSDSYYSDD